MGQCREDEHHNPTNGDGLQATTNGLLVWRKADNFTAFTDGYRTWVQGPFGLQERLNTARFAWEQSPPGGTAGATPTPTPSGTGGLVLAEGKQHEVCGIALTVKFVPPSQTGGAQDQAFLVAAQSGGGDVPSPSTVAPARAGTTVTVLGRRFTVNSVDLVNRRVSVEALC